MNNYTDVEKAVILEEIENSEYDDDIQEFFINEMFHPELIETVAVAHNKEEHKQIWESWKKEWAWDGTMNEEFEKDRIK